MNITRKRVVTRLFITHSGIGGGAREAAMHSAREEHGASAHSFGTVFFLRFYLCTWVMNFHVTAISPRT